MQLELLSYHQRSSLQLSPNLSESHLVFSHISALLSADRLSLHLCISGPKWQPLSSQVYLLQPQSHLLTRGPRFKARWSEERMWLACLSQVSWQSLERQVTAYKRDCPGPTWGIERCSRKAIDSTRLRWLSKCPLLASWLCLAVFILRKQRSLQSHRWRNTGKCHYYLIMERPEEQTTSQRRIVVVYRILQSHFGKGDSMRIFPMSPHELFF